MFNNSIKMIAITGGPCGGKSTFLAKVHEWLQSYGIQAIVISETATELINSGISPNLIGMDLFEEELMRYQITRERFYWLMAEKINNDKCPVVILCDRGILDCAAYVERSIFIEISRRLGYSIRDFMGRYKMVVHLTTAAIGAEEFYTLENNKARKETVLEAKELDGRTQQAWLGHPHHVIIDSQSGFDEKMLRALQSLARVLNMPQPTEVERKFRVINFNPNLILTDAVELRIVQDYLTNDGTIERRIRSSELNGQKTFFYTEKKKTGELGKRHENESIISLERYQELYAEKDLARDTIEKTRHCFLFFGKKFELDVYTLPVHKRGLVVLEVELLDIDEEIKFPSGWELEDVTGRDEYDNSNLAKRLA